MNPLIRQAVESVQGEWILGFMTLLFFGTFLFVVWWVYAPEHKEAMDEAAEIPFMDGDD